MSSIFGFILAWAFAGFVVGLICALFGLPTWFAVFILIFLVLND